MKNLRFFVNSCPSDDGISYKVKSVRPDAHSRRNAAATAAIFLLHAVRILPEGFCIIGNCRAISYDDSGVKRPIRRPRLADGTKDLCALCCTGHSDEPRKAKIVFSRGFHDFRVSSPSYKSHLHNILLCYLPSGTVRKTF